MRTRDPAPIETESLGFTLIELLMVIFILGTTAAASGHFGEKHGIWAGVGAGTLFAGANVGAVILFYRWSWKWEERRCTEIRELYRGIYRVVKVPTNKKNTQLGESAEIRIGDFGWEAEPFRDNELLYLQGLTVDWDVVWHAGFEPGEVEYVGPKPSSQYDRTWGYGETPPSCPFPVERLKTGTLGLPYPNFFRRKKTTMRDT